MPLRARIRADACPPNDVTQGATGAAAPVVHLASLKGQGFGRLLEHALETFVFATLLDRPYVLDIRSRDPAFTWRSFFTHGDYNWRVPGWMEPLIEQAGNEVVPYGGADVRDGGAGLPDGWFFPGASELERANATRMEELVTREWAGGGPRGAQYALVPNWGTSTWFLAKGVRKMVWELMAQHRCAGISEGGHAPPGYGRWYGMAFLFKPTVLAWEVYRRDKANVLGEGFGDDTPFGAIHLRTENKHGLVQQAAGGASAHGAGCHLRAGRSAAARRAHAAAEGAGHRRRAALAAAEGLWRYLHHQLHEHVQRGTHPRGDIRRVTAATCHPGLYCLC